MKEWLGVDLDGTLAKYSGFTSPTEIGKPIPAMLEKVRRKIRQGVQVKIFTARAYDKSSVKTIKNWTKKYLGQELDVTNIKDPGMIELWDDRCRQVIPNKGEFVSDNNGGIK